MTSKQYDEEVMGLIEPYVYDWTAAHKGSISAEHGLGKVAPHTSTHMSTCFITFNILENMVQRKQYDPNIPAVLAKKYPNGCIYIYIYKVYK